MLEQLDIFTSYGSEILNSIEFEHDEAFPGVSDEAVRAALAADVKEATVEKVLRYARNNPEIWPWFQHYAFEALNAGEKIGAKGVWERVRWEVKIVRKWKFKANNNFPSYYARVFEVAYPEHDGFFNKRALSGLKEAA